MLTEKRRLGSRDGPPILVAVVPLHAAVDADVVTKLLCQEGAGGVVHQEQSVSGASDSFGLVVPRFKQRFTFLRTNTGKYHECLWVQISVRAALLSLCMQVLKVLLRVFFYLKKIELNYLYYCILINTF